MTPAEAKRAAMLVETVDEAADFHAQFSEQIGKYEHAEFHLGLRNPDGDGMTWEPQLKMPLDVAIDVLAFIRDRAAGEARKLGVQIGDV